MIEQAILKINPKARFTINANDINQITWLENTTPISKADIEAQIPTVEQELKDAEANKKTDASNGKQKLKELGLTDAEIKALIG